MTDTLSQNAVNTAEPSFSGSAGHIPVLLGEMLEALQPKAGGLYIDATFGGGGYSAAILNTPDTRVIAIDRDPDAIDRGRPLQASSNGRLLLRHGHFSKMSRLCYLAPASVDGIVFDLGVSSYQFDEMDRGFSFRFNAPLDMRMDKSGVSALDVIASSKVEQLEDIIRTYGEERFARRIASAIKQRHGEGMLWTTTDLDQTVRRAVPMPNFKADDCVTRTFQALRIAVNGELDELEAALVEAASLLKPEGRLVVVSFHSLEDRVVKRFLQEPSARQLISRHMPISPTSESDNSNDHGLRALIRKPVTPQKPEMDSNPRSRSAKLRAAEKHVIEVNGKLGAVNTSLNTLSWLKNPMGKTAREHQTRVPTNAMQAQIHPLNEGLCL